MSYILEHTKLGFCGWDLVALILLIVIVVFFIVKYSKIKKEENELEDQLEELLGGEDFEETHAEKV